MRQPTMGSFFSGSGGFELAGAVFGFTPVWASEIEPFPIRVTQKNFPDMKHYGDITKMKGYELEPVDAVAGGSPCQDMSIAGNREGLDGNKSVMFRQYVRVVKEMRQRDIDNGRHGKQIRPRYLVWENVPGAFSSNKGEDFREVLQEIVHIADETAVIPKPPKGKWGGQGIIMGDTYSIAWRVVDAQFWGVAQRRKRIYLVADFGGNTAPKILFKREGLSGDFKESIEAWKRTTQGTERSTRQAGAGFAWGVSLENHPNDSRVTIDPTGKVQTLTSRMGTGGGNVPLTMQIRSGCEGGGKGALIQENKSATLSCHNTQTLFEPIPIADT